MDRFEPIRRLRDEYESALDQAERVRDEYHRQIVKLHRSGMSLREIAEGLGISHQRVHQIVSPHEEGSRPRTRRGAAMGAVGALVLVIGGLWLSQDRRAVDEATPSAEPTASAPGVAPSSLPLCDGSLASRRTAIEWGEARCEWVNDHTTVAIDPQTGEVLAMVTGVRRTEHLRDYITTRVYLGGAGTA